MKKILSLVIIFTSIFVNSCAFAQKMSQTSKVNEAQPPAESQCVVPQYIKTTEYSISVIDPNETNNPAAKGYPGYRGANQLVVYTPVYGSKTNTNEYGYEAIVQNNRVIKMSGLNSYIPSDGFVISGHGKAKDWIKENIYVGVNVELDFKNKKLLVHQSPESLTYQTEQKLQQVVDILKQNPNSDMDTEAVDLYLTNSNKFLDISKELVGLQNYEDALKFAQSASDYADLSFYHVIPYNKGEFKGIWVRPTQVKVADIQNALDGIKKTGVDNIFLETYYQGHTIYPSAVLAKYGIKSQKNELKKFDTLKVWIDEAHKRNMKVHAWFQTFYVGSEAPSTQGTVLNVYPSWANYQKRNFDKTTPSPSPSEHNGYFLDPANPQVHEYLYKILNELVSNYDLDGLNIDYIRYPSSLAPNFPNYADSTWGYTKYARDEFKSIHNIDPVTLSPNDDLWGEWNRYKETKINNFVYQLKTLKKRNKNLVISAVIFPNETESSIIKHQNWKVWPSFHSLDAFTPLILASDVNYTKDSICEIRRFSGDKIKIYPGLFEMFTDGEPSDLLYQILASRQAGANGVVIFDYAHMNEDFVKALQARVFKNPEQK